MNLPASVIALLPEYVLILTGVLIMLIEAVLKPTTSRKPLGWLAIAGTTATGFISWYQLRLGVLTAFSGNIQVDAFSIFFHLLIAAVVVATLLGSLDYFEGHASC
jgi:NADH-quinone oxidoreductase subunit N